MDMSKWIVSLALAAATPALANDGGGVGGPISGFVLDGRANSLRAIEGLPGAARLGAPVRLPFAVAAAAVAFRLDYALVIPASGQPRVLLARGLRSGTPETLLLNGAIEPTSIAIASSGATAALHSRPTHQLQFIVGLPDAPRALEPVDTRALDGESVALAIDADGSAALLAAADGQIFRGGLGSATLTRIASLRGTASLSMLPDRDAAVALSAESGEIVLLDGLTTVAPSIRTVAGPLQNIPNPRAVQALDRRSIGVIADGRLAFVDLETGAVEWIDLAAAAENFETLDRHLFVLNRAGAQPLLLLDAAKGRSAWFVPPDRGPSIPLGAGKDLIRGEDRPN
jgi:hypothetical protein